MELKNKTIFVTGGANGIGLAFAEACARACGRVVIADRKVGDLAPALQRVKAAGNDAMAIALDVTDRSAFARAVAEVESDFGPIDLLCNNAGVAANGAIERITFAEWDWILGVNLGGVINGVATVLPRMLARGGGGYIVNVASAAALRAAPSFAAYSASKAAVMSISETLALEMAPHGIGVTIVCPGRVDTQIAVSRLDAPPGVSDPENEAYSLAEFAARPMGGMQPAEVATAMIEAVRTERLYLLTHPKIGQDVIDRANRIVAG